MKKQKLGEEYNEGCQRNGKPQVNELKHTTGNSTLGTCKNINLSLDSFEST